MLCQMLVRHGTQHHQTTTTTSTYQQQQQHHLKALWRHSVIRWGSIERFSLFVDRRPGSRPQMNHTHTSLAEQHNWAGGGGPVDQPYHNSKPSGGFFKTKTTLLRKNRFMNECNRKIDKIRGLWVYRMGALKLIYVYNGVREKWFKYRIIYSESVAIDDFVQKWIKGRKAQLHFESAAAAAPRAPHHLRHL